MDKKLKISGSISLVSGLLSFGWLIYNVIAYQYIRTKITNLEELGAIAEILGMYIGIGLLISFFFHVSAFFTMIFRFQILKKVTGLGLIALFMGIISFICLIGDLAALHDIGNQYEAGLTTNYEWTYLYLALIIHMLFYVLMFIMLYSTFGSVKVHYKTESAAKDEIIFIIAQYVGILCGFIGLGFTGFIVATQVSPQVLQYILPFYCPFILLPYGLICLYWIIIKRKERLPEVYDEKQWRDVSKAGLTTLLISIPFMAILYILNYQKMYGTISMIWFPFYLFLILLLFSGSILYFSNRM
ncbi:MAG: hypothetical protein JXB48_15110 [Candidatus Latescibacteria bacterium]|nr:hypothetical protein [Candidatus Latescibacterota bacterium]